MASAWMNQTYQPSEARDRTLRSRAKWATSEVMADQGQMGDPTTSVEFVSKTGIRTTICGLLKGCCGSDILQVGPG
jgi:hypothetical protein